MSVSIEFHIPDTLDTLQIKDDGIRIIALSHGLPSNVPTIYLTIEGTGQNLFSYCMGEALRPYFSGGQAYKIVFEEYTGKAQLVKLAKALKLEERAIAPKGITLGTAGTLKLMRQTFWAYAHENGADGLQKWCNELVQANIIKIHQKIIDFKLPVLTSQLIANPTIPSANNQMEENTQDDAAGELSKASASAVDLRDLLKQIDEMALQIQEGPEDDMLPRLDILRDMRSFIKGDSTLKEVFEGLVDYKAKRGADDVNIQSDNGDTSIKYKTYGQLHLPFGMEDARKASNDSAGSDATLAEHQDLDGIKKVENC